MDRKSYEAFVFEEFESPSGSIVQLIRMMNIRQIRK
jgi:hypothetical protein